MAISNEKDILDPVSACVCVCVHVLYGKYYELSVCGSYNLYIVVLISSVWIFGGGALGR